MTVMEAAHRLRKSVLLMASGSGEGHVASSFSIIEQLLAARDYMDRNGFTPEDLWSSLILSKGHGVFGLYALMIESELWGEDYLSEVAKVGGRLIGHVPHWPERKFYWGTGSLGIGLAVSIGLAYGRAISGDPRPVITIVGDGEMNEGVCWESLLLLKKFPTINLKVLVDENGSSERAIPMREVFDCMRSGWPVRHVDGHDQRDITQALDEFNDGVGIVVCKTVKGFPVSSISNNPVWHHRSPSESELRMLMDELEVFYGSERSR